MVDTIRLTVSQAIVRFLGQQYSRRDGCEHRLVEGFFGIFGHGNVAGMGQALLEEELRGSDSMPYYLARNEQGAVHAATGFAKHRNRLSTLAVTTSVGPGATNMITGAALATTNRIPVLLFPSDTFANRGPDPVLQQLERADGLDVTVNDAFRSVSVFFDRILRPEQVPASLLHAMRVLSDPAQAGAVTIALPEDVQAEAFDWPVKLFRKRVWQVSRTRADAELVSEAAQLIRGAKRPFIVAGGGVHYSGAEEAVSKLSEAVGIPVGQTHAGKGVLPSDHPFDVGGVGATGTTVANGLAAQADVVIGIGTRYSDFTTASNSLFSNPDVAFVNLNVTGFDTVKLAGLGLQGDAREVIAQLSEELAGYRSADSYHEQIRAAKVDWSKLRAEAIAVNWAQAGTTGLPAQVELLGVLNEALGDNDVIVNAAGSAPGDLHRLWEPKSAKQYHVEYAFSTMGYEIAGALGVKMASPDSEVVALVGDGSYLMLAQEIVTAVSEGLKLVIILIDNHGYGSIGNLSESVGSQRFGTRYRFRDKQSGRLDGGYLPVDFVANLRSLGADVLEAKSTVEFRSAVQLALDAEETTAIYVQTDPLAPGIPGGAWWDVPVAEVSSIESTQAARAEYESGATARRRYF